MPDQNLRPNFLHKKIDYGFCSHKVLSAIFNPAKREQNGSKNKLDHAAKAQGCNKTKKQDPQKEGNPMVEVKSIMRAPSCHSIAESYLDSMLLVYDHQTCADEPEGVSNNIPEQTEINLKHLVSKPSRNAQEISTHNCAGLGSAKSCSLVLSLRLGTVVRLMRIASLGELGLSEDIDLSIATVLFPSLLANILSSPPFDADGSGCRLES
jgi:hypothetical protein